MTRRYFQACLGEFSESFIDTGLLLACIVSCGVLITLATVRFVEPAWTAPGWPSYHHYPKNAEIKSMVYTVLSVPIITVAFASIRSRLTRAAISVAVFLAAFFLIFKSLLFGDALAWIWSLGGILLLIAALKYALKEPDEWYGQRAQEASVNPAVFLAAGLAGVVYLFLVKTYLLYYIVGFLDLHHLGEQMVSAIDLLRGGRPFESVFWSHGLADTGLSALAYWLTSRVDLPTHYINRAAFTSLSMVSILLLSYGLRLRYYSILILFLILFINYPLVFSYQSNLVPVLIAMLIYSKAKKWYVFVLSGVTAFMAHIYRIDYGVYGFVSIMGLGAYQVASALLWRDKVKAVARAKGVLFFLAGVLSAALFIFLALGWPGYEWYRITFYLLPRYLSDSGGLPFPIPFAARGYGFNDMQALVNNTYLFSALGLIAAGAGYVYACFRRRTDVDAFFVLVVLLSAVSLRSAFNRSGESYIQFCGFVYLTVIICLVRRLVYSSIRPWLKVAIVILPFVFFNFRTGSFGTPFFLPHRIIVKKSLAALSTYNDPLPGQCSKSFFSELNLRSRAISNYDRGICEVKRILDRFKIGDRELLVTHSASMIYPTLGYRMPTRYYAIGWAITPQMQRELVSELEASGVKSVLRVNPEYPGIQTFVEYDIPDEVRLPVYDEWFKKKFDQDVFIKTSLGDIFLARGVEPQVR